jgi:hypothetical protein
MPNPEFMDRTTALVGQAANAAVLNACSAGLPDQAELVSDETFRLTASQRPPLSPLAQPTQSLFSLERPHKDAHASTGSFRFSYSVSLQRNLALLVN